MCNEVVLGRSAEGRAGLACVQTISSSKTEAKTISQLAIIFPIQVFIAKVTTNIDEDYFTR
jgi:hypothetical protein